MATLATLAVTATDFSRNLSDYLKQVQYRGQVLDIERGKRVVARVSPVTPSEGYPILQLDALLAAGPQLKPAERASMANDVRSIRAQLRGRVDPWAS